jgi:hypothetical protein
MTLSTVCAHTKVSSSPYRSTGKEQYALALAGATNFHGYAESDPEGLPSTHVPLVIAPNATVPWHIDRRYAWEDVTGFGEHTGSAIHTLFNDLSGSGGGQ